jgi:hypothetical protein
MVWFKFTERHDWRPTKRSMRSFPEGAVENVPRACAEEAVAEKKGFLCDREGNPVSTAADETPSPEVVTEQESGADAAG